MKALFLDRDGVINLDHDYVHRIDDFEFVDGIFELCRLARDRGYLIVVITNQAGIGRGLYTEQAFEELTDWMVSRFADEGTGIAAVYHCPYHAEHGVGEYKKDSFDRKPNPGMILRARDELDLDLAASILLGDKESDILAGVRAGVGRTLLMRPHMDAELTEADACVDSLKEAYGWMADEG